MFESAELGHKIEGEVFDREEPRLREALLSAQVALTHMASFPVVIVMAGVDGAGKGETVNLLNEWMDPRHIKTYAYGDPSDEERERPRMWRFWRDLPPKGKMGIFFDSWYADPIHDRVEGKLGESALEHELEEMIRFEEMLVNEGALVLKFWLHLSKKAQKKRLKSLEEDPDTSWRVTKEDWKRYRRYDVFRDVSERALRRTSTPRAPWIVVEGADKNYRSLTVGKAILTAIEERLRAPDAQPVEERPTRLLRDARPLKSMKPFDRKNVLRSLDLSKSLEKKAYKKALEKWQARLGRLIREPRFRETSVVAVFEGQDAAGKGGAIRRVTSALDARNYRIIPIAAPTEEERAQPYLWRFWRQLPRRGMLTVFDRSWYGRVLVERVEGFCSEADWSRAYGEINDFEHQLVASGTVVVKFWLSISKEEQLKRFREREEIPFKRFKITDEDWRNREKWPQYERAVCDMVDRTSTDIAPWRLIPANDKNYARIEVLKTLCKAIERSVAD